MQETTTEESKTEKPTEHTQTITPFKVSTTTGSVDYQKLVNDFGCSMITPELLLRLEKVTKIKPHLFLRRGIFFSHRDFEHILDCYE